MGVIIVEYRDEVTSSLIVYIASSQEKAEQYIKENITTYDRDSKVLRWWATYNHMVDSENISDFRFYDKYGKIIHCKEEAVI